MKFHVHEKVKATMMANNNDLMNNTQVQNFLGIFLSKRKKKVQSSATSNAFQGDRLGYHRPFED